MIFKEMRTPETLSQVMAKYWAQYLRQQISGFEVVKRAALESVPQELFGGGMISQIQSRVRHLLTTDNVDAYERILASNLLNGFDIQKRDGGVLHITGILECYSDKGYISIAVDYHPDWYLGKPLEVVFGEEADAVAYFFPFKTTMMCRFLTNKDDHGRMASVVEVSEGYRSERMELLDDLTKCPLDRNLNYNLVNSKGFEFCANDLGTTEAQRYGYRKGEDWIPSSSLDNFEHAEFVAMYRDLLK